MSVATVQDTHNKLDFIIEPSPPLVLVNFDEPTVDHTITPDYEEACAINLQYMNAVIKAVLVDNLDLSCLGDCCEKEGYSLHIQHRSMDNHIRADKKRKKDLHDRRIHGILAERRSVARDTVKKVNRRELLEVLKDQFAECDQSIVIPVPITRLAS